jgi:predicted DNA-binding protein
MTLETTTIETTVSQELAHQLNQYSLETGRSVAELVQEAIYQYLETIKTSLKSKSQNLEDSTINQEILILQKKVQSLELLFHQVSKLEAKITSIEKIIIPEVTITSDSTFAQLLTDDSDEDEPDEILTDFLT